MVEGLIFRENHVLHRRVAPFTMCRCRLGRDATARRCADVIAAIFVKKFFGDMAAVTRVEEGLSALVLSLLHPSAECARQSQACLAAEASRPRAQPWQVHVLCKASESAGEEMRQKNWSAYV